MSPYQIEKKQLIESLVNLYPYPKRWFETKSNHVLLALLKKKKSKN